MERASLAWLNLNRSSGKSSENVVNEAIDFAYREKH